MNFKRAFIVQWLLFFREKILVFESLKRNDVAGGRWINFAREGPPTTAQSFLTRYCTTDTPLSYSTKTLYSKSGACNNEKLKWRD